MTGQDVWRRDTGGGEQATKIISHAVERASAPARRVTPADPGTVIDTDPRLATELVDDAQPLKNVVAEGGNDYDRWRPLACLEQMQAPTVDFHQPPRWRKTATIPGAGYLLIHGASGTEGRGSNRGAQH